MIIDLDKGDYQVSGQMGGGGGGGGGNAAPYKPVEANDSLASKQSLRIMLALGEGPITSVNQIYVNGTPISGYSATHEVRLGLPDQTAIAGYANVETPFTVSVQLLYNAAITRAVSSSVVDAVRITLRLNSLMLQQDNGDVVGNSVTLAIATRPNNTASWTQVTTTTKSGKASQPYSWDVRVNRPAGGVLWELRIIRQSLNDPNSKSQSITLWDSYTELQDTVQTYPNTALLAVTFTDSTQLGGRVPEISCDVTGRTVKIPHASFYNPATRVYTGVWNYAWALSDYSSSNPAWILYDVLTNSRVGLGISESELDKSSFWELAKYCDEAVSDGKGGTEPRFKMDNQFYTRENAPTFLGYLLAICNGNLTTANGLVTVISDRPATASRLATNANVIDGMFDYSSADLSERFTSVNVTYNDPADKGNTTTVTENDSALIARYGLQSMDVVLIGCTSAGQARRKARWVFETQSKTSDILTFKTGLQGLAYNIGDIIDILDNDYANVLQQGLVKAAATTLSTTALTLDRDLALPAGTLNVLVYGADGVTLYDSIINQSAVTTNTITTALPLATDPAANSPFIIKGAVLPRPWRVSSISAEGHIHTIVCTAYDATKYSRIDTGVTVPTVPPAYVNIDAFSTPAVANITFTEAFRNDGLNNSAKLVVKWEWDNAGVEKYKAIFDLLWRRDNLAFTRISDITIKEAEIIGATPGVYEAVVYAYNVRGIRSPATTQIYNYRTAASNSTLVAPISFYVAGTTALVFASANLSVTWEHNSTNDSVADVLLDYLLEVWSSDGLTKKRTVAITPSANKSGQYVYTYQYNLDDFAGAPQRTVQFKLYSRDITGRVSVPVAANFTNPVPAAPSFTVLSGVGISYVSITPPADPDVTGYLIYRSITAGFTPGPGNLAYDGPDTYVSLQGDTATTYYFRVAAYDSFGKTGLNAATQSSTTTLSFAVDAWTKTGLDLTANTPVADTLYWSSGTILKNALTSYTLAPGSAPWSTGTLYLYFDPSASLTVLQTTTTLATAVGTGTYPIATYTGGAASNIKGGDGSAFISGSQIIAGSVGASQLVAGSAVITGSAQLANALINTAHINDGQITDAKIGGAIQSTAWNPVTFNGWKLDKAGNLTSYGALELYDASGNAVLTTGAAAAVNWAKVGGMGKPENNATVGGTFSGPGVTGNISGNINPTNVSTYIANVAIQTAQIALLAVDTAQIKDLAVDTLKIAGHAVTVPLFIEWISFVTVNQNVGWVLVDTWLPSSSAVGYETIFSLSVGAASVGSQLIGGVSYAYKIVDNDTGIILKTGTTLQPPRFMIAALPSSLSYWAQYNTVAGTSYIGFPTAYNIGGSASSLLLQTAKR